MSSQKRKLQLIDDQSYAGPSRPAINWKKCILCQETTGVRLQKGTTCGLQTLSEDLQGFSSLGALPKSINLSHIDDGSGLAETMIRNDALYHKSCRSKYDKQKLDRVRETLKKGHRIQKIPTSSECLTRSKLLKADITDTCLFCDGIDEEKNGLVNAQTLELGPNILFMAQELREEKILAKLSSADLVAQEAKYHKLCYVQLRTKFRSHQRQNYEGNSNNDFQSFAYGSALLQLVDFIESTYMYNPVTSPVFKMTMLTKKMEDTMKNFGIENPQIHSSRLRERLLCLIPGLEFSKSGREVLLFFRGSMGDAIRNAVEHNAMSDGMCLARAAKIVRRGLFEDFPKFEGSFSELFIPTECVNKNLVLLLQMIIEGSFKEDGLNTNSGKIPMLSIAQLIRFNAVKSKRREEINTVKHSVDRETPLPLYVGLKVYSTCRSKTLINHFNKLGICVSYDRVQQVLSTTTNAICETYEVKQKVVPSSLHPNIFSTVVIDNVDHNPSSTTASNSFHGTSITIIQHPDYNLPKKNLLKIVGGQSQKRVTKQLPLAYSDVAPVSVSTKRFELPVSTVNVERDNCHFADGTVRKWLEKVNETVGKSNFNPNILEENISWSAFSANQDPLKTIMICNQTLLPLLNEKVQSPAVVAHCLLRIRDVYEELNLNSKVIVLTGDQPIYALAKQLQWTFPKVFGEDQVVVMMGGLHIEMATMSMIGSWLSGSGWIDIIIDAGITSSGKAESFLSCSHVKRTRYAHQVTLAALYILKSNVYYETESNLEFNEWCIKREDESAQFLYWSITMELEILLLSYVQSLREGNFTNFKTILSKICPWMFAMDHTHYARWLPIFVQTLQELETRHPEIHEEFMKGKFVSRKSNHAFSCMADDQLHEQNNKTIKGIGGAIGLLDNPSALFKWMVAGPVVAEMISDFENISGYNADSDLSTEEYDIENQDLKHTENTRAFQKSFLKDVLEVVNAFKRYGNPFEEDVLSTAVTKTTPEEAETSVREAREIGRLSYEKYVNERIHTGKTSVHAVINRCNLTLFKEKIKPVKNKLQMRVKELRKDANIFCKLYIASQIRDSDVLKFFAHENHQYPPSISEFGKLRNNKKSEIIKCIASNNDFERDRNLITNCSALIVDGAALVHALPTAMAKNFAEYSETIFKSAILRRMTKFDRVDVVFDRYLPDSLKGHTRLKRGFGTPMIVKGSTPLPKSFSKFLQVDNNKKQLFNFLASDISSIKQAGKLVVFTLGEMVTSSTDIFNSEQLVPCSHEEADTRILLHLKDSTLAGHKNICIETVDSDVIVIAIGALADLRSLGLEEIWFDFGVGKNRKQFPLSDLIKNIPSDMCKALPFFHAFTGCDTVSSFYGVGKVKAWNIWRKMTHISEVFLRLSTNFHVSSVDFEQIEQFTIFMYDSTSTTSSVNECRRILFSQKNRAVENIPPTLEALRQHVKRSILQANIWKNCLQKEMGIPDITNLGWKRASDSSVEPHWSDLPEASTDCQELVSCRCKTMCIKNCKCSRLNLDCTTLCTCDGQCVQ